MDREDFQWKIRAYTGTGTVSGQKGTGAFRFCIFPFFGTYGRKELFTTREVDAAPNVSESESGVLHVEMIRRQ